MTFKLNWIEQLGKTKNVKRFFFCGYILLALNLRWTWSLPTRPVKIKNLFHPVVRKCFSHAHLKRRRITVNSTISNQWTNLYLEIRHVLARTKYMINEKRQTRHWQIIYVLFHRNISFNGILYRRVSVFSSVRRLSMEDIFGEKYENTSSMAAIFPISFSTDEKMSMKYFHFLFFLQVRRFHLHADKSPSD